MLSTLTCYENEPLLSLGLEILKKNCFEQGIFTTMLSSCPVSIGREVIQMVEAVGQLSATKGRHI